MMSAPGSIQVNASRKVAEPTRASAGASSRVAWRRRTGSTAGSSVGTTHWVSVTSQDITISVFQSKSDGSPMIVRLARAKQAHDELWNAAQLQMVHYGWMHNSLRM